MTKMKMKTINLDQPKIITMTSTELQHAKMVKTLSKPAATIRSELTDSDVELLHMVVGISGEAGELLDAIKKRFIYRKELDIDNIVEELGDLEYYLEGFRQALNITRENCLAANIEKLAVRYKDFKYTDSAATRRADKGS